MPAFAGYIFIWPILFDLKEKECFVYNLPRNIKNRSESGPTNMVPGDRFAFETCCA